MKHNRFLLFTLVAIILAALMGSTHTVGSVVKAQPELLQLAHNKPDQTVSVIVQKSGNTDSLEVEVEKLGGRVAGSLDIINSFYAEMTAEAAVELSRLGAVRWVSLDAEMASSACSQCVDTKNLANSYIYTIRADKVWNDPAHLQGQGIGVAVVDSSINRMGSLHEHGKDARWQMSALTDYSKTLQTGTAGTHVSSVMGGDGSRSNGKYIGI
jgi:serine protease AprX